MKKLIILLYLIIPLFANCQILKYTDLLQILNTNDLSLIDEFLVSKGYTFRGTDKEDSFSNQKWKFEEKSDKNWYVMRLLKNNELECVTYSISDQKVVLSLKNEVKQFGFKLIESKEETGLIIAYYRSAKYKILFITGSEKGKTESQIGLYSIDRKVHYFEQ